MRRNTFRLLLILSLSFIIFNSVSGQYAFIPDTNFRNFLVNNGFAGCMQGDSLDTTCTTVVTTSYLNVSGQNIYDLSGIRYFDFLNTLNCTSNNLSSLPHLPNNTSMIICAYNNISSFPDLSNLSPSVYLDCSFNNLSFISAPFPPSFEYLDCSHNNLTELPYIPFDPIAGGGFHCDNNFISFIFGFSPYIGHLSCSHNNLSSLPTFPGMMFLDDFDCSYNNLTAFPEFQFLPDSLSSLNISDNPIPCIPAIKVGTFFWANTNISCLPLSGLIFSAAPQIINLPLCSISSDCPGFWNISGKVFSDLDSSCTQDSGEIRLDGIPVLLKSGGQVLQQFLTDSAGQFSFRTELGNYLLCIDTMNAPFRVVCPATFNQTSSLTINDSIDSDISFGLLCNSGFDLIVRGVSPLQPFRPGFSNILIVNAGDGMTFSGISCANNISGSIQLILDDLLSYISPVNGALTPSSVNGDTISWSISDFSQVDPIHDFNVIIEVSTLATIADSICLNLSAFPTADNIPGNNYLSDCFPVSSSLDPNEKYMSPAGIIDTSSHWFTFTIFFQNTGNIAAEDIYILDTLNQYLDATTFSFISSSHEAITQMLPGEILRFNFPDINLADSNTNEPASHGFVKFKVKRKDSMQLNESITNTAHIFFDFNASVATNTVSATLYSEVGIDKIQQDEVKIYPNPGRDQLTVDSKQYTINSVEISDLLGQVMFSRKEGGSKEVKINLSEFPNGVYFIKVFFEDGLSALPSQLKFIKH